jgi:thiol-disulfide isomerase/thioredoxin
MNAKSLILAAAVVASASAIASAEDGTVQLTLVSKGASSKLGGPMPQRATLSSDRPSSIKKVPGDLTAAMYGTLAVTSHDKGVYNIILDEPDGKPARLYVDANGNGDLTDDAPADWTGNEGKVDENGKKFVQYNGGAMVNLGTKDKPYEVHLSMYRFDKADPGRAQLKDVVLYYRDYATEGEMKVGDKTFKVMMSDNLATGDFRGKEAGKTSGVQLLVDVNGNGKFDGKGESFDVRQPFNLGGTTYELKDVSKDGLAFKVAKSDKTVAEIPLDPDLSPGKPVLAFEDKTMDGKAVKFPGDYKGKVVMIDFWATWCGPCMAEVPNVVANYEKYHSKGFEILGITLDKKDAETKIKEVTTAKNMTWPQVYDGGYWEARIAVMYGIHGIPAAYLVDGDTGKIITSDVRGPRLEKALEKALADKNKH